jgi:plasmid stabilization system protein ParE
MALKIIWTKRAKLTFENIIEYTQKEWGDNVTKSFLNDIKHILLIISEFPKIGSIENVEKQIRGIIVRKQLTLFYRIKDNAVIILIFFDNRQNPLKKNL